MPWCPEQSTELESQVNQPLKKANKASSTHAMGDTKYA
jgi:hypothetical protein